MNLIYLILTSIFFSSYSLAQTKVAEAFEINFYPSFDNNLDIKLESFTDKTYQLTLKQDYPIWVRDSICENGTCNYYFTSVHRYEEAMQLQKPNFIFEIPLSQLEFESYRTHLENIGKNCSKFNEDQIPGTDGISIIYQYSKGSTIQECEFWSPSARSQIGKKLLNLLGLIEDNPNGIIERTVENIKWYFDGMSNFKIISINPLYIKVIDVPFSCKEKTNSFIDSLPGTPVIYLDFTNYKGNDTSCFAAVFGEKYPRIRWIISRADLQRYKQLYKNEN